MVLTLRTTQFRSSAHKALMKIFSPLQARLTRPHITARFAIATPSTQRGWGAPASGRALDGAINEHRGAPGQAICTPGAPSIWRATASPTGIVRIFTLHLIKLWLCNSRVATVDGSSSRQKTSAPLRSFAAANCANSGKSWTFHMLSSKPRHQGFERCSNLSNLKRLERSISSGA